MAKTFINKKGYRCFANSGKLVHLWVAKKKYGNIPKDCMVHHKDGNKLNNHPDNLELVTKKSHARHHFELVSKERKMLIFLFKVIIFVLIVLFLIVLFKR